jgi:hypothetical protein
MHGEFLRALFLQDHQGMQPQQTTDSFRFSFAARHPHEEQGRTCFLLPKQQMDLNIDGSVA